MPQSPFIPGEPNAFCAEKQFNVVNTSDKDLPEGYTQKMANKLQELGPTWVQLLLLFLLTSVYPYIGLLPISEVLDLDTELEMRLTAAVIIEREMSASSSE